MKNAYKMNQKKNKTIRIDTRERTQLFFGDTLIILQEYFEQESDQRPPDEPFCAKY